MNWKEYQEVTAQLFRQLGCKAEVEKIVKGARGEHEIDVWVTFSTHGIETKWVIECKYWNSEVTKEKALVLKQIVEDVGADKGIIISKSGYQKGAYSSSKHTNILLKSLSDLRKMLADEIPKDQEFKIKINQNPSITISSHERKNLLASLRKPSEKLSCDIYRAYLIDSQDQQVQEAVIAGFEVLGGSDCVILMVERLLDQWGIGAICRTIKGLNKMTNDGGLIALSSTLLLDYRTFYEKIESMIKALRSTDDTESISLLEKVINNRVVTGMDSSTRLRRALPTHMEIIEQINNEEIVHGIILAKFFSNKEWSDLIPLPRNIESSIDFCEEKIPGLLRILQKTTLN